MKDTSPSDSHQLKLSRRYNFNFKNQNAAAFYKGTGGYSLVAAVTTYGPQTAQLPKYS
jgi:hypothetical protein